MIIRSNRTRCLIYDDNQTHPTWATTCWQIQLCSLQIYGSTIASMQDKRIEIPLRAKALCINDECEKHTTAFQNGDQAEVYRSLTARMLVLQKFDLLMFDGLRPTVGHRDSGDYLGPYQKDGYDRNTIVLKTRYLVYLVDAANQLLHDQPLLFTTKGAMCGDFGEVYQKFRREMSRSFGQARGIHKPRGDKFMALSVLEMTVKPVLKGKDKKSWVCSIAAVNHPTAETWTEFFVGYDEVTKLKVYAAFDEWVDFGLPEHELEAQQRRQLRASEDLPSEFSYEYVVTSEDEIEF